MTKEELEKENEELKAKIEKLKEKLSNSKGGPKKFKTIKGLTESILHDGKMYLVGMSAKDVPEEIKKLHGSKIGQVEVESKD